MPGLWDQQRQQRLAGAQPLAERLRPRQLDEFVGQSHFLGEGKMLRRMLQARRLTSVIFYGPPGTGKTTLARLIAHYLDCRFEQANAAAIGVREVRQVLDEARRALEADGLRTVFFLDEIHRFNRAQQDVLLGDVERGIVTLIGATTENPFFAINSPLVSRSQIFQFQSLTEEQITSLLRRAISDPERGYGQQRLEVTDEALQVWATLCDGDARRALTALEIAVLSGGAPPGSIPASGNAGSNADDAQSTPAVLYIDRDTAEQSIQRKAIVYDGTGDEHYDAASALIKSMRGSDPDAAVYWVARMLEAGEDPRFIARRIAILASEDIGNADPRALTVAAAAYSITERIGMPECQLTLAQAAIYMATAPKSNASAVAIWTAMKDVREGRTIPVPRHLRDAHYPGAQRLGHGAQYQYAHDSPTGYVAQDYLGVEKTYYEPTGRGYERSIAAYLQWIATQRTADDQAAGPVADADEPSSS